MTAPLTILIAGGTGFIGKALIADRIKIGDRIIIVSRNKTKMAACFTNNLTLITWEKVDKELLRNCDFIINLAGANISEKRWSRKRKQTILDSRIKTTQLLTKLCIKLGKDSPSLFNASAIGIYPLQSIKASTADTYVDETMHIAFPRFTNFLNEVGIKWEKATLNAKEKNIRVVNLRFGIVLSPKGGMLKKLLPLFKLGLGQKIGSGKQIMSWISLQDVVEIIQFLIIHTEINGPINITSPDLVTQSKFANLLAKTLHRPRWLSLPGFFVKILFGQMGEELLLRGQAVKPKILQMKNYHFITPTLNDFLQQLPSYRKLNL